MNPPEIVVVGSYNRDVALYVDRLPGPGETVLGNGRLESPGGKGSNQAIQAARAGAATAMVAAIGQDGAGDEAMALWAAEGIDTAGVVRLAEIGTGMAAILVDAAAENLIVVDSGANARLASAHVEAAAGLIGAAKLTLAQLETPAPATLRAFEIARAAGAATLLNAAPAPKALDQALLALTDILVVNEGEGMALSGHDHAAAIGEALLQRVGRAVVVTLGARGAMLFEHRRPPLAGAPPPVQAIDTTGAGDAFVGAFAARWAAATDAPAALAWGLAAGALACTAKGAALACADGARIAALAQSALALSRGASQQP
jgi:ribokinase